MAPVSVLNALYIMLPVPFPCCGHLLSAQVPEHLVVCVLICVSCRHVSVPGTHLHFSELSVCSHEYWRTHTHTHTVTARWIWKPAWIHSWFLTQTNKQKSKLKWTCHQKWWLQAKWYENVIRPASHNQSKSGHLNFTAYGKRPESVISGEQIWNDAAPLWATLCANVCM